MSRLTHLFLAVAMILSCVTTVLATDLSVDWATDGNGWVLVDDDQNGSYEKFFPLGVWYHLTPMGNNTNELSNMNTIYIDRTQDYRGYMSQKYIVVGYKKFEYHFVTNNDANSNGVLDPSEMTTINNTAKSTLRNFISTNVVSPIRTALTNSKYMWCTYDEPERNQDSWFWDIKPLNSYLLEIHEDTNNDDLTIVGFGPQGTFVTGGGTTLKGGNKYFYSKWNSAIPTFPYGETYYINYDGSTPSSTDGVSVWNNNVHDLADYYRDTGNVFMINDYNNMDSNVDFAGTAVDNIHTAISSAIGYSTPPVWVWIKVEDLTASNQSLRYCEIFTAIIHGCTGIFFYGGGEDDYGDPILDSSNMDRANDMAYFINNKMEYIKGTVINKSKTVDGKSHIHYSVRSVGGSRYAILTNTASSGTTQVFGTDIDDFPFYSSILMGPYEYKIIDTSGNAQKPAVLDGPTDVEEDTPEEFALSVAPNPFNPTTTISFTMAKPSDVTLSIYSVSGQKVATLVDDYRTAGTHAVTFDGANLSSGAYFYRFNAAGIEKTGKMLLVK